MASPLFTHWIHHCLLFLCRWHHPTWLETILVTTTEECCSQSVSKLEGLRTQPRHQRQLSFSHWEEQAPPSRRLLHRDALHVAESSAQHWWPSLNLVECPLCCWEGGQRHQWRTAGWTEEWSEISSGVLWLSSVCCSVATVCTHPWLFVYNHCILCPSLRPPSSLQVSWRLTTTD